MSYDHFSKIKVVTAATETEKEKLFWLPLNVSYVRYSLPGTLLTSDSINLSDFTTGRQISIGQPTFPLWALAPDLFHFSKGLACLSLEAFTLLHNDW